MRVSIICLLMTFVAACTVVVEPQESELAATKTPPAPPVMITDVIDTLADSLFDAPNLITKDAHIAVGTFGSIKSLRLSEDDSMAMRELGLVLQEGLKSALTKKRIRVIEYRLMKTIELQKEQDVMLSRDLKDIEGNHDVDYFLTGTLLEQPRGIIINAQLVDVRTKQIVTAATHSLDHQYLNGSSQSIISNEKIYRFAN